MKEGAEAKIPIKGIVRNTPFSIGEDGELDEAVNLRQKDGSCRPTLVNKRVEGLESFDFNGWNYIYIHTGSGYKNMLGIKNRSLYCFAKWDNATSRWTEISNKTEIMSSIDGDVELVALGNLVSMCGDKTFAYLLYEQGRYMEVNADYNGLPNDVLLRPDLDIEFRVSPNVDRYGSTDVLVFCGGAGVKNSRGIEVHKKGYSEELCHSQMLKALRCEKEMGRLKGFFKLIYAYELFDGNHVLHSSPILMNQANDFYTRMTGKHILYSNYNNKDEQEEDFGSDYLSNDIVYDCHPFGNTIVGSGAHEGLGGNFVENGDCKERNFCFRNLDASSDRRRSFVDTSKEKGWRRTKDKNIVPNIYASWWTINNTYSTLNIISVSNKLQYKISSGINKGYKDIIKGVSVFITKEVYGFDPEMFSPDEAMNNMSYATYMLPAKFWNGQFKNRTNQQIIEELERNSLFYKVATIDFDKLMAGGWIDIDLSKDGVLANLETQERLRVDNYSRNSYFAKTAMSYNGKLHIADYSEKYFHGFPLRYFRGQNASGQFECKEHIIWKNSIGNPIRKQWREASKPAVCIEVDIETDNGLNKVVRYEDVSILSDLLETLNINLSGTGMSIEPGGGKPVGGLGHNVSVVGNSNVNAGTNIWSLNPIISYPDSRATKMRITVYDAQLKSGQTKYYVKQLDVELKPDQYNNFAYYIKDDLKPIDIMPDREIEIGDVMTVPEEKVVTEVKGNIIKVSEVNNPMYFPPQNTYMVGSGKILRLVSNAASVGTGQVGDTPLYVMSTDGIWALFVDASGQLTYTNARPISRDVLNARQGVKNVDGGIVFTTDRGLMLIEGVRVSELSQKVEGDLVKFASDKGQNSLLYAKKLLENVKSIQLDIKDNSTFSGVDFKVYINGARIAYNHSQRELIVANRNYDYHYIYGSGNWYIKEGQIDFFVEDYPVTYAMQSKSLVNIDKEIPDTGVQTMFLSRPIKLGNQAFKQLSRVVLRGDFDVKNENYVNSIDFRDIDMSVKADKVVLSRTQIRNIRLRREKILFRKISYPEGQSPYKWTNEYIGFDIEQVIDVKHISGIHSFDGYVLIPKNQWSRVMKPADYRATLYVRLADADKTIMSADMELNRETVSSYQRNIGYKTYHGYYLLYENGRKVIRNSKNKDVTINGYSSWSDFDYIKMVVETYEAIRVTIPLPINYTTLTDPNQYFTMLPVGLVATAVRWGAGDEMRIHIKPELDWLRDTFQQETISSNTTKPTLPIGTPYSAYDVVFPETAGVSLYIDFMRNIAEGGYNKRFSFKDVTFDMIDGEAYEFTDLMGGQSRFVYKGESRITYLRLYGNLLIGVYERLFTDDKILPQSVYLEQYENVTILEMGSSGAAFYSFVYEGKTGEISSQQLLDIAKRPDNKDIVLLDDNYELEIANGTNIELTLPAMTRIGGKEYGGSYRFRFYEENYATGYGVGVKLGQLMPKIVNGTYPALAEWDEDFEVALQKGNTHIIDRDGNRHLFVYKGNSPIKYKDLMNNISNYTPIIETVKYAGVYVYGSYDGERWALLGRNERTGKFRDLGCLVEKSDCKFFKIMFFGNLSHDSSIEYVELQGRGTLYGNKIR